MCIGLIAARFWMLLLICSLCVSTWENTCHDFLFFGTPRSSKVDTLEFASNHNSSLPFAGLNRWQEPIFGLAMIKLRWPRSTPDQTPDQTPETRGQLILAHDTAWGFIMGHMMGIDQEISTIMTTWPGWPVFRVIGTRPSNGHMNIMNCLMF